jgi:hypothetical protein
MLIVDFIKIEWIVAPKSTSKTILKKKTRSEFDGKRD